MKLDTLTYCLTLLSLLAMPVMAVAQQDTRIDEQVESLLDQMTLEEKIGQMNQYSGFWDVTGPSPEGGNAGLKYDHLEKGWVGSMLNITGQEETRRIQEIVMTNSRLKIPVMFGYDVIHGHKTLAPIPLAEAASWDLEAIEASARVAATEASARGIHWTFAPMVDISRDARWGRVMEGAGEDPYLGSKIGAARVRGFQGDDLSDPSTIAACAKHFAAYGFAEAGREYNTADVGTYTLYNIALPPFHAAVDAGVKTIMNSFNVLNGVPATGDKFLQREILKGRWGFEGFVISDWSSSMELVVHGFAEDLNDAAKKAVEAGSDMDMESYAYIRHLKDLVESGEVDEALIDDAVRRILRVKFELGLFDDPYRYCSAEREETQVFSEEHQEAVLDVAKRSIVLLKNEDNLLPLSREQKGIAVIGTLADDKTSPLGSWRLGSDDGTAVSFLEGLDQYSDSWTFSRGPEVFVGDPLFVQELQVNETDRDGMEEAVELAKNSEVVIMVLGEHAFQSGEARSRTNLDLPGLQQELLEAVHAVNPNIVLVLMNGRPLALPWAAENVPAIVEAWQLGTQSGNAISQVLFGDYNPSGKLPMTFPRSVGQVPIYYNHFSTGRPSPPGMVFWSHYIDEENTPLYPFGHGLSYTSFEYADLKIDAANSEAIKVSVTVTNTGKRAGEEVVQLYIHDKVASLVRPVKELKGFDKIELDAGESTTVEFVLTGKELGFYNQTGEWLVEAGEFDVMVGGSSVNGLTGSFVLK